MSREDLQEMMCGIVKNAVREVLDEFRQHRLRFPSHTCGRKLDDTILRFELCPTAAETRGWSREDWMQLIHEFIQTLDPLEKVKLKQGIRTTPRTHIANTQWVAFLHHDGADECD